MRACVSTAIVAATALTFFPSAPLAAGFGEGKPEPSSTALGKSVRFLPWKQAGWTAREAAAHLLDRLTFGARPGEVDQVVEMGLEAWLSRQLGELLPEPELERRLSKLPALKLSLEAMVQTYPSPIVVRRMAVEAGIVREEELAGEGEDRAKTRQAHLRLQDWSSKQGWHPDRELVAQLLAQKLLRAVYAENQVREVLTDFWFNHFYVGLTDPAVRQYLLAYERDAIRPNVLGCFRAMLEATAKHPAMLLYLDNANSSANPGQPTLAAQRLPGMLGRDGGFLKEIRPGSRGGMGGRGELGGVGGLRGQRGMGRRQGMDDPRQLESMREDRGAVPGPESRRRGLNENYARELLELHTLGVDGGYTQQDVVEVARAFTGWTVYPLGPLPGQRGKQLLRRAGSGSGWVEERETGFLFVPFLHDAGEKTILGKKFPKGRGFEEGLEVLDLLASHPSTARHVARKFAMRFVADEPPPALVERLAARFEKTGGDLRELVWVLVESPEFWAREVRAQKIKSPMEYAVGAVRALGASVDNPFPLLAWVERMGQPLYRYGAPTGFPEVGEFWVSAGNLMARMNFGLELATGRLPGVRFELAQLSEGREPESARHALEVFGARLLPGRSLEGAIDSLLPLALEPELSSRVAERDPTGKGKEEGEPSEEEMAFQNRGAGRQPGVGRGSRRFGFDGRPFFERAEPMKVGLEAATPLELALGVLLGSPEFQRR
jgi:uncharacterized protein (DUF1800 family)